MLRFTVRRLLLLVPILIGLSLLVFVWIRALPGTPAEALLGERADEQSIAEIRDQLGLDDPFYVQYWRYVQTLAEGDLGTSIVSRRPITEEIKERFPATIELASRPASSHSSSAFRSDSSLLSDMAGSSTTRASSYR